MKTTNNTDECMNKKMERNLYTKVICAKAVVTANIPVKSKEKTPVSLKHPPV